MGFRHSEARSGVSSGASSELFSLLGRLEESARSGDWTAAQSALAGLAGREVTASREQLREYLAALHRALANARASRADAVLRLRRLRAVANFQDSGPAPGAGRHDFGETPYSWRAGKAFAEGGQ